ncbi:S-adenosylmethionine decarboxylase [Epithele typhae]|uniref:S-adenosylmethionine decarboxylase n=1 Tax=Epithele typhae TaxID=378194 RepID=UPI002007466B|nr:S-adenosylmethionine decarboxylase [Epithele typhae]KAH9942306.1 S-adenosylmethionine decarboxylase [Epithele typhae]
MADSEPQGPFEGPEKLLEIWFAPSPADCPQPRDSADGKTGLRTVPRAVWEEMLDIVKCKILSVVEGTELDAYLLSESSFFVSPHRLILKTCGTTLNLLGLPRILEIAREHAGFPSVYRLFYSRKAFMFPERQIGPHREWTTEIEFLDNLFPNGSAYTVGKVNGDHCASARGGDHIHTRTGKRKRGRRARLGLHHRDPDDEPIPEGSAPFFFSEPAEGSAGARADGLALSAALGISDIFPAHMTTLDAYAFAPCGYSCNALLKWRPDAPAAGASAEGPGEGYYTIHVTPEAGWSYASFECNVPLPAAPTDRPTRVPDLRTLVRRVVDIFRPGRLTLTLFISSDAAEGEDGRAVEAAQRAFRSALTLPAASGAGAGAGEGRGSAGLYKRTDKINYEFGGYDLAFASFELRDAPPPPATAPPV